MNFFIPRVFLAFLKIVPLSVYSVGWLFRPHCTEILSFRLIFTVLFPLANSYHVSRIGRVIVFQSIKPFVK